MTELKVEVSVLHIFLSPCRLVQDKVSWRLYINRTRCSDDAKTVAHHTCKKKFVVVNKTGKVEVRIADNQSWNSCHKVVSDHELTSGSGIEPTKKKSTMLFDHALYMATYFSQKMVPLPSECTGHYVCLLR